MSQHSSLRQVARASRQILRDAFGRLGISDNDDRLGCLWLMRLCVMQVMAGHAASLAPAPSKPADFGAWLVHQSDFFERQFAKLFYPCWFEDLSTPEVIQALFEVWVQIAPLPLRDDPRYIGWLYQYYQSDAHRAVVDVIGKMAVSAQDIPAATQLFTPDWIAQYLVENTLGRLWHDAHPHSAWRPSLGFAHVTSSHAQQASSSEVFQHPQAENCTKNDTFGSNDALCPLPTSDTQTPPSKPPSPREVAQSAGGSPPPPPLKGEACRGCGGTSSPATLDIESLTILDPCVGCGHILLTAFDVLLSIYQSEGVPASKAARQILAHHLRGCDIDPLVVAIADACLKLRALACDATLFDDAPPDVAVHAIADQPFFHAPGQQHRHALSANLANAGLFGTLLHIPQADLEQLDHLANTAIDAYAKEAHLTPDSLKQSWLETRQAFHTLAQTHLVVCTNPPYLNKLDTTFKNFLRQHCKGYHRDLFAAFVLRCSQLCEPRGLCGYMTPNVWLTLKSFAAMRQDIIARRPLTSLVELAKGVYFQDATVDLCAFVLRNAPSTELAAFYRLDQTHRNMAAQRDAFAEAIRGDNSAIRHIRSLGSFSNLPQSVFAYWMTAPLASLFERFRPLREWASIRQGMATTDNQRFLRRWYELPKAAICFDARSTQEAKHSQKRWFPYNKGGQFCRWYGNQTYVVDYANDGAEIKANVLKRYPYLSTTDYVVKNSRYYFQPSLSWTKVSSGRTAFRCYPEGFIFDVAGCAIFFDDDPTRLYVAGFLNTRLCAHLLAILSPTLNYETGHIATLPIPETNPTDKETVIQHVRTLIALAKEEWDERETSWHFQHHPIATQTTPCLQTAIQAWRNARNTRRQQQTALETALENHFMLATGLTQCEILTPNDPRPEECRDDADAWSILSYIIGQHFGRFSAPTTSAYLLTWSHPNLVPSCLPNDLTDVVTDWLRRRFPDTSPEHNLACLTPCLPPTRTKYTQLRDELSARLAAHFYDYHTQAYAKHPIIWQISPAGAPPLQIFINYFALPHMPWSELARDCTTIAQTLAPKFATTNPQTPPDLPTLRQAILNFASLCHTLAQSPPTLDFDDGIAHNHDMLSSQLPLKKR